MGKVNKVKSCAGIFLAILVALSFTLIAHRSQVSAQEESAGTFTRYRYAYGPDTPGWTAITMDERYDFYRIPEEVVQTMSNAELVQAIIDHPYMSEFQTLSVIPEDWTEHTKAMIRDNLRSYCTAYDALLKRGVVDEAFRTAADADGVSFIPASRDPFTKGLSAADKSYAVNTLIRLLVTDESIADHVVLRAEQQVAAADAAAQGRAVHARVRSLDQQLVWPGEVVRSLSE